MSRPLLLDLFCGAGGAAMGYHRAGFDVIGVDINPQPNYPFFFIQSDALEELRDPPYARTRLTVWKRFSRKPAAIHASPPCQRYSAMSNCRPGLADDYPDLVDQTRALLQATGLPWVIENVEGSSLLTQPSLGGDLNGITLCGHMFGLKLYRHRIFESNIPLSSPPHPRHITPASKAGHWVPGTIISVSGGGPGTDEKKRAMGIDWMTREELAESIPPAFSEYIGAQLLDAIRSAA